MIEQTVEELTPVVGTRPACRALGAAPATIYRRRRPPAPRPRKPRRPPARALSAEERQAVLVELHSERFVDASPAQVWATLLDEGRYQALGRRDPAPDHAETVFVLPAEAEGTVRVRIFTPWSQLPFAGNPILGAAWVLAAPLQRAVVEIETASGIVPVTMDRDESGALVFGRMVQPVPTVELYAEVDSPPRRPGGVGVSAPGRAVRQRAAAHVRRARVA